MLRVCRRGGSRQIGGGEAIVQVKRVETSLQRYSLGKVPGYMELRTAVDSQAELDEE